MKQIGIGILGLGTVGAGTAKVIQRNQDELRRRLGCDVNVVAASVRSLTSERDCDTQQFDVVQDPFLVVDSADVDIVVELIGGEGIAKDLVERALDKGKQVITANKALLALHGNSLFERANKNGVSLRFEAAVAGGIPIIKALREGLSANRIEQVAGIINGTTNFILTEMRDKGRSFDDVLREAQDLGYAEADPTFDVEGIDAAHKLTILASIAYGIPLDFEAVYTEGISHLELTDVAYARELGYRIKHLGIAKHTNEGLELRVHPTLIPKKRLIAHVDGVMNAILVKGDATGNTLHYGAGAGAEPTASAVVADILDVAKSIRAGQTTDSAPLGFQADALQRLPAKTREQFNSAFYLRFEVEDVAGVMSALAAKFAERNISIEGITQKEPEPGQERVSVIFITQTTLEKTVDDVIANIESMNNVHAAAVKLRVEHLK